MSVTPVRIKSREHVEKVLLTDNQAAAMLSISRAKLWNMVKEGRINPVRIPPRCTRFRVAEIAAFADQQNEQK